MRFWSCLFSWLITTFIGVLGVGAGQTIWYYAEPVIDSQPMPMSYYLAAYSGIFALILSLVLSVLTTVMYISTPRSQPRNQSE